MHTKGIAGKIKYIYITKHNIKIEEAKYLIRTNRRQEHN